MATRRPELAGFLRPLGDVGRIVPIQVNVRNDASVRRAIEGADVVVNLVGIMHERGRQRFAEIHHHAARRIAVAATVSGVRRLVHISALGADPHSPSRYARSKAAGERAVREAFAEATILRPGIVFGPEDDFFNRFAALARIAPALPVFYERLPRLKLDGLFPVAEFEAGTVRFQPVYVGDVADAVRVALGPDAAVGQTYELGGPTVYSFRELLTLILKETRLKRPLLPVPLLAARILAVLAQFAPRPVLTPDQVTLLRLDNVVASGARGLADLGITPSAAELILPTYLHRHRRGRTDASPLAEA